MDEQGQIYIHVKAYKNQHLIAEVYFTGGTVRIHCRDCKRWHKVVIREQRKAELELDRTPTPLTGQK